MNTGTLVELTYYAGTGQKLTGCCACEEYDAEGRLVESPGHDVLYTCRTCGHLTCAEHRSSDGRCWGCCYEGGGE